MALGKGQPLVEDERVAEQAITTDIFEKGYVSKDALIVSGKGIHDEWRLKCTISALRSNSTLCLLSRRANHCHKFRSTKRLSTWGEVKIYKSEIHNKTTESNVPQALIPNGVPTSVQVPMTSPSKVFFQ